MPERGEGGKKMGGGKGERATGKKRGRTKRWQSDK